VRAVRRSPQGVSPVFRRSASQAVWLYNTAMSAGHEVGGGGNASSGHSSADDVHPPPPPPPPPRLAIDMEVGRSPPSSPPLSPRQAAAVLQGHGGERASSDAGSSSGGAGAGDAAKKKQPKSRVGKLARYQTVRALELEPRSGSVRPSVRSSVLLAGGTAAVYGSTAGTSTSSLGNRTAVTAGLRSARRNLVNMDEQVVARQLSCVCALGHPFSGGDSTHILGGAASVCGTVYVC
jgi:hypothetical protein